MGIFTAQGTGTSRPLRPVHDNICLVRRLLGHITISVPAEVAQSGALKPIAAALNDAWNQFWTDPDRYVAWEMAATDRLFGESAVKDDSRALA